MAIAEVGSGTQRNTTFANGVDSLALAFPGNVTASSLLVCGGQAFNGSGSPASIAISDTVLTPYTVISFVPSSGTFERMWIAYGIAPSSGANTVTVNPSNATDDLSFSIDEFSGVDTSSPLSVDGGHSEGTGTAVADSIITATANELIIGVMGYDGATTTITKGASWIEIGQHANNSTDEASAMEFGIVTTAQSYSVDWTLGTSLVWQCMTASFKAASSVTPSASAPFRRMVSWTRAVS